MSTRTIGKVKLNVIIGKFFKGRAQNRHKMRTLQTRNIHNPSKAWVLEKGIAGKVRSMGGRDYT